MRQTHRTITRLAAVGAAALAATGLWIAFDVIAGIDLRAPASSGGGATHALRPATVLAPAVVAALAGWGVLALLERLTDRARIAWIVTAIAVFVLSLSGPLTATGITAANQLALALMHVVVAATLIPLLARTSPAHAGGSRSVDPVAAGSR